jgi:hypothetical protein
VRCGNSFICGENRAGGESPKLSDVSLLAAANSAGLDHRAQIIGSVKISRGAGSEATRSSRRCRVLVA